MCYRTNVSRGREPENAGPDYCVAGEVAGMLRLAWRFLAKKEAR